MFNRITHVLFVAALLASLATACSGSTDVGQDTTTLAGQVASTVVPTTAPVASTSTTATVVSDPGWTQPPVCDGKCDPPIQVLFTVPVGDNGVSYANIDLEETLGSGPGAFAIDEASRVWIVDEVDRQLLAFALDGSPLASVDLTAYEVASVVDIAAGRNGLLLLDIDVATERYRLLQLDRDGGELMAVHDLPSGLWLEDGLTGIAAGPNGQLWVELEFGNRVAELDVTSGSVKFSVTPGYPYPAGTYGPVPGDPFSYQTADVEVTVTTDSDLGGLSWLGLNPDGSFVLTLDEVHTDNAGVIQVDETVHLFDATGNHFGEAVFPLAGQFIDVFHPMTVGPDGNTYALLTRPDHIALAVLPYAS